MKISAVLVFLAISGTLLRLHGGRAVWRGISDHYYVSDNSR